MTGPMPQNVRTVLYLGTAVYAFAVGTLDSLQLVVIPESTSCNMGKYSVLSRPKLIDNFPHDGTINTDTCSSI